jgi:hypothetical protein
MFLLPTVIYWDKRMQGLGLLQNDTFPRLDNGIVGILDDFPREQLMEDHSACKVGLSKRGPMEVKKILRENRPDSRSSSDSDSSDSLTWPWAFLASLILAVTMDSPGCLPRERDTA